jgi:hypothetical protein
MTDGREDLVVPRGRHLDDARSACTPRRIDFEARFIAGLAHRCENHGAIPI